MSDEQPVSVLLPTVEAVDAIGAIADQLREADELLVCCDAADDPVADAELPDGARPVVAGEPEACSGKANALAAGMEAASHERLVWTDDDFEHDPDWLDGLRRDYAKQGPTTELPLFRGSDPLALCLEPTYVLTGAIPVYRGGVAWGGSVIFERSDLTAPADAPRVDVEPAESGIEPDRAARDADAAGGSRSNGPDREHPTLADGSLGDEPVDDEAAFLAELRRTFSDDGLLSEYVDVTGVKRIREVDPPGGARATLERHVRWSIGIERIAPVLSAVLSVLAALLAVACVLFPLPSLAVLTGVDYVVYRWLGIERWTFLLALPAVLVAVPLGIYVRSRSTLRWGGRRYRWPSQFEVEVQED